MDIRKTDERELRLILGVAKKYYELGMTQEEIAAQEFISKSSVCRLLQKADEMGFIDRRINYPDIVCKNSEDELYKKFSLIKACVMAEEDKEGAYAAAAGDICRMASNGEILSVTPGSSVTGLAKAARQSYTAGVKISSVIALCGLGEGAIVQTRAVADLARAFSAQGYILPAPLYAADAKDAAAIMNDAYISGLFGIMRESDFCVTDICAVQPDNAPAGAVGSVAGHYYDASGNIVASGAPVVALSLEEIKIKAKRLAVTVDVNSAPAIAGALNGGIVNMLYTDVKTARAVMAYCG